MLLQETGILIHQILRKMSSVIDELEYINIHAKQRNVEYLIFYLFIFSQCSTIYMLCFHPNI